MRARALLVVTGLLAACSDPPPLRSQALRLFTPGSSLQSVVATPDGAFIAAGEAAGQLLIARIADGIVDPLPIAQPRVEPCAALDLDFVVIDVEGLAFDDKGAGLITGRGSCSGTTGVFGYALVLEDGAVRALDVPDLGLPVAVACRGDRDCLVLGNARVTPGFDTLGRSTVSVRRLDRDGFVAAPLFEIAEASDDEGYDPLDLARTGDDTVVLYQHLDGRGAADSTVALSIGRGELDLAGLAPNRLSVEDGHACVYARRSTGLFRRDLVEGTERRLDVLADVLVRSTARFGQRTLLAGERSQEPGVLPFLVEATESSTSTLDLPRYGDPSSIAGIAANGTEAIAVGYQTSNEAAGRPRPRSALVLRIASALVDVPDGILPDAPTQGVSCLAAEDCLDQPWGVRCDGHFACVSGTCDRLCDLFGEACGNGICEAAGGETAASCGGDCSGSKEAPRR